MTQHPYETLFNEYKALGHHFQYLGGIVQNDIPLGELDLEFWQGEVKAFETQFQDLQARTVAAVTARFGHHLC